MYCCIPESMETKRADPFNYKLRSRAEVEEQMKYYSPDFWITADYKRYTAGDYRQNTDKNLDDRERVSKLYFDMRVLNLQPLQRERLQYLLGPRWNPKKPHDIKIVTKQYATFLENYFKGMETIKELYWESLRAPMDPVNLKRNPYLRERFIKKKFGKTRPERLEALAEIKKLRKEHELKVDAEEV